MLRRVVRFQLVCDVPECNATTPVADSDVGAAGHARVTGWQRLLLTGTDTELWRCPQCVKAGRHPTGWLPSDVPEKAK